MRGKMVVIEGLDGSGKSTLAERLAGHFEQETAVKRYVEPGGTPVGDRVREMLKDSSLQIGAYAEALLFAAARAELAGQIAADLKRGTMVIVDRWVYSSLAYQGAARGLGVEAITSLNAWALETVEPDAWIYLELSPLQAAERRQARGLEVDRIEAESLQFFTAVSDAYRSLAEQDARSIVLPASLDPDSLAREAIESLRQRGF